VEEREEHRELEEERLETFQLQIPWWRW